MITNPEEYLFLAHEIAERISDKKTDFEIKMNHLLWCFDVSYTEHWGDPYGDVEFMGDREMTADYYGTTLDDFVFQGVYNEDGEEVDISEDYFDIDWLQGLVEKELNG